MTKINVRSVILVSMVVILLCCITAVSATDNNTNTAVEQQHNNTASAIHTSQVSTNDNQKVEQKQLNTVTKSKSKQLKTSTASSYSSITTEFTNAQKTRSSSYTINLKNNTYNITKPITLKTPNNCHKITINGNGAIIDGQNKYNFLDISGRYTINMNNLTIRNCYSSSKGAVITKNNKYNVTLNLSNVTMYNNKVKGLYGEGGSLYLKSATLNVKNSNFYNNYAYAGGVFYLYNTRADIINSNFYNNSAKYYGGAIYSTAYLNILTSRFYLNNAGYRGGAIHTTTDLLDSSGTTLLSNSVFYDNTAINGGVISTSSKKDLTINNCRIYRNNATYGAVVSKTSRSTTIIKNSNIWNNTAKQGGVVYSIALYKTLLNSSQIKNNTADDGSIIYNPNGTIIINKCNLRDNIARNGLIYSTNGNTNITYSNITMKNKQYTTHVVYKNGQGYVLSKGNNWGTKEPNYGLLFKRANSTNKTTTTKTTSAKIDEGCCSNIIQLSNNESVITFRRDSSSSVDFYITNDTITRQQKTDGTYFFHCYVTSNGWMVGNGGTDSAGLTEKTEAITLEMINQNNINKTYLDMLLNIKKDLAKGHVLIKAPNGTFGMVINYNGKTKELQGVLKPGEYIVSPNSPDYYRRGYYMKDTKISNPLNASRYLAATDKYGIYRQADISYYYKTNLYNTTIQVYASNDDGHLVGRKTSYLMGNIYAYNQFISKNQIPKVMNAKYIETINYTKMFKSTIKTENITSYSKQLTLKAYIKDQYGNNVNDGKIVFKINGRTLQSNNKTIYVPVKKGLATLNYKLPSNYSKNTYTLSATFSGTNNITGSKSTNSNIKILAPTLNITQVNASKSSYANITVKLTNNKTVLNINDGFIILKINGKTIFDNKGKTVKVYVKNGVASYRYKIPESYTVKNYKITAVYSNTIYRVEGTSILKITKTPTVASLQGIKANLKDINVKGVILNNNTKSLINGTVKAIFKINGNTLRDESGKNILYNITNGNVNLNITLPQNLKSQNYTLTMVTQENSNYFGTRANTNLELNIIIHSINGTWSSMGDNIADSPNHNSQSDDETLRQRVDCD